MGYMDVTYDQHLNTNADTNYTSPIKYHNLLQIQWNSPLKPPRGQDFPPTNQHLMENWN